MADDPQIRVVVAGMHEVGEKVVRRLILDATSNLIEDTPVDTGWARANWVPAIGTPDLRPRTANADVAMVPGASVQQQSALAQAATWKWGQGSAFISNNVPYIGRLNDGSSTQAPAGFVQAAIDRAVHNLRGLA